MWGEKLARGQAARMDGGVGMNTSSAVRKSVRGEAAARLGVAASGCQGHFLRMWRISLSSRERHLAFVILVFPFTLPHHVGGGNSVYRSGSMCCVFARLDRAS